ncbi:hypothetical protein HYW41_01345 [Candidatus Daviesbacteria bacterium]|nr:hypothetical protein [Candidatus Daviesbacteria bacterium]
MNNNEIKNWLKLIYDELPNVVKPLFFLSIFFLAFLAIGNNLKLNESFWLITKEKIFNLAFYLGMFTFIFRAINKAPLEYRKINLAKKYPIDRLNKDYFLGQYENFDKVFIFELNKTNNKKSWIVNLQTKRHLWGAIQAKSIKSTDQEIIIDGKSISLNHYLNGQEYDEEIDIFNLREKDNVILVVISIAVVIIVLTVLNIAEICGFLQTSFFRITSL